MGIFNKLELGVEVVNVMIFRIDSYYLFQIKVILLHSSHVLSNFTYKK